MVVSDRDWSISEGGVTSWRVARVLILIHCIGSFLCIVAELFVAVSENTFLCL